MGIVLLLLIFLIVFTLFRRLIQTEEQMRRPGSSPPPRPLVPRRDFLKDFFQDPTADADPNEAARRSGSWG